MARRSARLRKRSVTPSEDVDRTDISNASWETAPSRPASQNEQNERLPSVIEGEEPVAKTPTAATEKKPVKTPGTTPKASRLPQLTMSAATPNVTPSHTATSSRTPSNRTPMVPPSEEMHPALHHQSTAKVLDEARWLGFQNMGAHTAPPKSTGLAPGQSTPSKTPTAAANEGDAPSGFEFRFRMKSPFSGLSPKSSSILKSAKDAMAADARSLFKADEFSAPADMKSDRKTAVPKGKAKRFSDAHSSQFKKMDSIANHASAFRTVQLVGTPLKKTPSKTDLHKPESSAKTPKTLKRTQSKMDMTEAGSSSKAPASSFKSKMAAPEQSTKIAQTPLKRTQSKMDLTGSSLPRSQSTVRLVPPSRDGRPGSQDGNPFAKRVKRTGADDAATTRPASRDGEQAKKPAATPAKKITSQTALPRLASRLMTPTKASLMRSQSVKVVKTQSMLPTLAKSPSTANMFSPSHISNVVRDSVRGGIRKTSASLQKVRSILRTPSRKFSNDMDKIAAGTHMSPPPGLDVHKALPVAPQTVPAKKHVVFTSSTLERDMPDDFNKSPSPMKMRAGSEVPVGAVIYPTLRGTGGVEYPSISTEEKETGAVSPSRRLTFGGTTSNTPGEFSFTSDRPIDFGPTSTGTIRMVRKSNASSMADGKKRKLQTVEESSDKENSTPPVQEGPSAKKARIAPTPAPEPKKTPSKLPRSTPSKRGASASISRSRLAFLSTPKRGKA